MKFVTVMDMWLLAMNCVLLGSILFYGRKLITLIARAVNKVDDTSAEKERTRICNILRKELTVYQQASSMGDKESESIVDFIEIVLQEINASTKGK